MGLPQAANDVAVVEGPRGIPVDHDHRLTLALVEIVQTRRASFEEIGFERVQFPVYRYHTTSAIEQFKPLPIPIRPTRSPD